MMVTYTLTVFRLGFREIDLAEGGFRMVVRECYIFSFFMKTLLNVWTVTESQHDITFSKIKKLLLRTNT